MMYFITILVIVLFCLGWRKVTDDGMLLNFLRRPFEDIHGEIDRKTEVYTSTKTWLNNDEQADTEAHIFKLKLTKFIVKPFVLCITCMASVWGIPIYIYLNGLSIELIPCIISASFIQTFIWQLYERIL